ncbi:gliding motility-associated C-terminal domain-containing protein [Pontibacter sp. 13R65]|uniref:Ig-like domain-containing protein n=1 Tax=Pontibacter sp. 13R65 TaxID=3127458 RepID=UPI00301D1C58
MKIFKKQAIFYLVGFCLASLAGQLHTAAAFGIIINNISPTETVSKEQNITVVERIQHSLAKGEHVQEADTAAGIPGQKILSNPKLGNSTLAAGAYKVSGNAYLDGPLTVATGAATVIQVTGDLIITEKFSLRTIAGTPAANVFWLVDGEVKSSAQATLPANIIARSNTSALVKSATPSATRQGVQANSLLNTNAADLRVSLQITQNGVPIVPGRAIPYGTILTYTYVVENRGPDRETNVSAELTIPGINNDPNYNYIWNIGTLNSEQLITFNVTIRLDIPGASTVSIAAAGEGTDSNPGNNSVSQPICVTPPVAGTISTNVSGNYVCEGSKIRFSVPAIQGATTYNWVVPQGWTWIPLNPAQSSIEVTVGTGTGEITVFGSNGCGNGNRATPRSYVSVSPNATPVIPVITSEGSLCTGNQITFRLSNPEAGISYRWNRPSDWTVISQTATAITFITSSPGAVSVTATNACNKTSVSRTVEVSAVPPAAVIASEGNLCIGGEITFRIVQPVTGMIYRWVHPAGWQVLGTDATSIRLLALSAGEVRATVTAEVAMNCTSEPGEPILVSGVPAAAPVIVSDGIPCAGDQVTFQVSNPEAGLIYQWDYPASWTFVSRGASSITLVTGAGDIAARAVNAAGCVSAPSNAVTVTERPAAPTLSIDGELCPGSEVTFRIMSPVAGVTYQWDYPASWTRVSQTTASISVRVAAGEITARGVNAAGCIGEPSEPVVVLSLPATPVIANEGALCPGSEIVFRVENPETGIVYSWSYPSSWSFVSQDNASINLVAGAGQITATAENGAGCQTGPSNSIAVPAAPATPIISNQGALCVGNQLTFQITNPEAGQSYVWKYPSNWVLVSESNTAITLTVATGEITASAAAGLCGPGPESNALVVSEVPAAPVIFSEGELCPGTTKEFRVENPVAGMQYNWSYPATWSFVSKSAASIRVVIGVGEISARARSATGCESAVSNTISVTEELPPAPVITNEGGLCAGSEVTFRIVSPVAGTTYQWNYPSNWTLLSKDEASIRLLISSGTITATALNSCDTPGSASNAIVVSGEEAPVPAFIVSEGTLCIGAEVTFRVASPEAGATYQWNYPAGWTLLSEDGGSIKLRVGTGLITATTLNSCGTPGETGNTIIVSDNTQPGAPVITYQGSLCVGSEVVFRVQNPQPGMSYQWSYPSNWAILSESASSIRLVVGAGAITAKAINGCGLQSNASNALAIVPGEGQLAAPVIGSQGGLCAGSEVTFRVLNSEAGVTYKWNYPADWALISQDAASVRLTVGVGTITALALPGATGGCPSEGSNAITISDNIPPAVPVLVSEGSLCAGSEVVFRITAPQAGLDYRWNYPVSWSLVSQDAASITLVTGTGNVSVTATNTCNGLTAPSNVIEVAPTPAEPGAITADGAFCVGQQLVLSVAAVPNASSYVWSLPEGWIGASTGRTIAVTVGATGGTVSVSSRLGNCISAASTLNVTPNALPAQPGTISVSGAFCVGRQVTLSVPAVAGMSYAWTVPAGWTIDSPQGTSSVSVTVGTTGGAITVQAANASGCTGSTSTLNATPFVTPAQPGAITANGALCVGQLVSFSVPGVPGATYYTWVVPSGWTITAGQGTGTITARVGAAAGAIAVTAGTGNEGACASAASTLNVTPNALPAQPGTISVSGAFCVGRQVTLSVPAVAGMSYAWTVPAGWTIDSPQGTSSVSVTVGTAGGAITVQAANASGCTGSIRTLNVSPFVIPTQPGGIIANGSQCVGQLVTYSVATVSGASYYTWAVPSGWTITAGQGTTSITARVGTAAGAIAVTAGTGNEGACASAASTLNVTPVTLPAQPGAISASGAFCYGREITLSVPAVAGMSYNWMLPDGWVGSSSTNTILVTVGATGGMVSVSASNATGCISTPRTLSATLIAAPLQPGAITANAPLCVGQQVTFSIPAVSGLEYNWSLPDGWTGSSTTNTITVTIGTTAGVVSVIAVNAGGCTSPARSLDVNPSVAPAMPGAISATGSLCVGNQVTFRVENRAGVSAYNWILPSGWSGSSTTNSITVTVGATSGTVSVTASAGGCPSPPTTLPVTPVAGPAQPSNITASGTFCAGREVTLSVPAVSGLKYNWSVPATWSITSANGAASITAVVGTAGGAISVTASNAEGCTGTARTLSATLAAAPTTPGAITASSSLCVGSQITLKVPAITGVTFRWTLPEGWTGTSTTRTITVTVGATPGTVSVVSVNTGGCTSSASTLDVNPATPATPGTITASAPFCATRQVTFSIEPVEGAASYAWALPTGWTAVAASNTTSITVTVPNNTTARTLSVRAVGAGGCLSAASNLNVTPVLLPGLPDGITILQNALLCIGNRVTFSVTAVAGMTYNWQLPEGWEGASTTNTITVTVGSGEGTVSVTATNETGCTSNARTRAVTPLVVPGQPGEITASGPYCAGGTVIFTIEPVEGATSYLWTLPGWAAVAASTTSSITYTVPANTTIRTLTVVPRGAGNCPGESRTLEVRPLITPALPSVIAGPATVCPDADGIVYSVTEVAGLSYNWTLPEDWIITEGEGTASITVKTGKEPGAVTARAANACFASVNSRSLAVTLLPGIPATPGTITSSGPLCAGTVNTIISIEPVPGATTYTWELPAGWVITAGQGSTDIEVTAGTTAGEITVTAGNSCGTSAASTLAVNAQPRPEMPQAITGDREPCVGRTDVVYTIPAVAGALTYNWTVPNGWAILAGQQTNSIRVRVGNAQGTVSVTAGNPCGTSAASTMPVVPVAGVPTAPGMLTGETEICVGRSLTYSVGSASRATSYTWTLPAGWSITAGQGTTQVTVVAGSGSGLISVVAKNSCGTSLSSSMEVRTVQVPAVEAINDLSNMCEGLIYEVAPVAGALTYNWTVPSGWSVISGQGTTRIRVTPAGNSVGAITVVVDNGTCLSEPVSLTPNLDLIANELVFPNVFSPNNDGNNDTWVIKNLGNYPNSEVSIINRWGNEVYRSTNYKNDWTGDNLSEGTYYYVARVKQCDGSDQVFKGFVMIMR